MLYSPDRRQDGDPCDGWPSSPDSPELEPRWRWRDVLYQIRCACRPLALLSWTLAVLSILFVLSLLARL